MKKLDFLIIGAQKSGTTALDYYLRQHPNICMGNAKEIHFFNNEANFKASFIDYSHYHQYFNCNKPHQIIGEATPMYMYWQPCIQRIHQYNPDIKLIIILRNPITRAYSHWNMEVDRNAETLSFKQALLAENKRAKTTLPYQDCVHSYIDRGFYSEQIRRVWRFFDPSQVLILKHEELKNQLNPTLSQVTNFLDIPAFTYQQNKTIHARKYKQALNTEDFSYLKKIFLHEIKSLETMLGWNCSNWLTKKTNVLFYRDFIFYTGGHQKVYDYFQHIQQHPDYLADIAFSASTHWNSTNPWFKNYPFKQAYDPIAADILFIAGMDWQVVPEGLENSKTVINLIQGYRHADPSNPLYNFLKRKAIRICVSPEISKAIKNTGIVNGNIYTINNGHQLTEIKAPKNHDIFILGLKNPIFAIQLQQKLLGLGFSVMSSTQHIAREQVFELMASSRISILLPSYQEQEGFYLPALEAMQYSDLALVPDCIGNRVFCFDNQNCLMPQYKLDSFIEKAQLATGILNNPIRLQQFKDAATQTLQKHSIELEREKFYSLLQRLKGHPANMYKSIILTGVPRSGSSLACSLLNNFNNTIALLEPMPVFDSIPEHGNIAACKDVMDFMFECRREILYEAKMQTSHSDGKATSNTFIDNTFSSGLRKSIIINSKIPVDTDIQPGFSLAIKHTAFFRAILADLKNFFECYATIRNPLSILASWNTIDAPINRGHIPAGERYDSELAQILSQTEEVLERQMIILEWFFTGFKSLLDDDHIIKYEDMIETNGNIFAPLSYDQSLKKPEIKLYNRNTNSQYSHLDLEKLYNRLINSDGSYWYYYSKTDVQQIYDGLCSNV